jgi:sugar phosphate isomerase/epimerase
MQGCEPRISLFSQSLFSLPLYEAIEATATAGFAAIELACVKPHLDLGTARHDADAVAEHVRRAGLTVSALSLLNCFTAPQRLAEEIESAHTFIRLAPLFNTKIAKMTPGPPGSSDATQEHWRCLRTALARLVPVASEVGVRLAFETHMRQLTDTLASSRRLLAMAPTDAVGLTLDFSNLSFAGEKMPAVISALKDRIYNTHLKNGYIDENGNWHFQALDTGLTDYAAVLRLLRQANYDGYLTIECLGPDAQTDPIGTAKRDLGILCGLLAQADCDASP